MIKLNDSIKTILLVAGALALGYGFYMYFNAADFINKSGGTEMDTPLWIAAFMVWGGAILTLNQLGDLKTLDIKARLNPIKYWGAIFKGTPRWVMILAIACFLFGIVNGFINLSDDGVTGIIDGKYVVHNHGEIIRVLTEQEYLAAKATDLKGMVAGHILFLGMGTGILYPRNRERLPA